MDITTGATHFLNDVITAISRLSTPAWTAMRELWEISIIHWTRIRNRVRLQSISNPNPSQNAISNLLSQSRMLIKCREKTKSNGPDNPSKKYTFTVATYPVYNKTGACTADCCKEVSTATQPIRRGFVLCMRVMGRSIAAAFTVEYPNTSW